MTKQNNDEVAIKINGMDQNFPKREEEVLEIIENDKGKQFNSVDSANELINEDKSNEKQVIEKIETTKISETKEEQKIRAEQTDLDSKIGTTLSNSQLEQLVRSTEKQQQIPHKIEYDESITRRKSPKFKLLNFKPLLVAVVAAIFVGTSFGFIVKNIILANKTPVIAGANNNSDNENGGNAPEVSSDFVPATITIPTQTLFVVQSGVFSSSDGADSYLNELKGSGVSSTTIEIDDSYYNLIAVSSSLDRAKEVSPIFLNKEIEFFAKPFNILEKQFEVASEADEQLIQLIFPMYEELVNYNETMYLSSGQNADLKDSVKDYGTKLEQLELTNDKLQLLKEQLLTVTTSLLDSDSSLTEEQYLANAQKLLDFLNVYNN